MQKLLIAALLVLAQPTAARALLIEVTWSAALSGAAGTGTATGNLGVFDISTGTERVRIPRFGGASADVVEVSGFSNASRNGTYLLAGASGSLGIQFTSLSSGHLVDSFGGAELDRFLYTQSGSSSDAPGFLLSNASSPTDTTDLAILCRNATGGTGCDPFFGPVNSGSIASVGAPLLAFTIVPEPSAAALLVAGALLIARRARVRPATVNRALLNR